MAEQRVKVIFTEQVKYERVFLIDTEGVDLDDLSSVHEALDEQDAWDQPSTDDWGRMLIAVEDRSIDEATIESGEPE